jgi:hypothetical protein
MMEQLPPGGEADAAATAAGTTAAVVSRIGTLSCSCLKNPPECGSWTAATGQAGLEEGSPMMMQLPPGGGADAAVAAATAAVVSRMGTLPCSCLKNLPECGSWTAVISQTRLEEGSPMMVQLPGGADAAVAAATAAAVVSRMGTLSCRCLKNSPECGSWTAAISQAGLEEESPMMVQLPPGGGADAAATAAGTTAAVVSRMGTLSCSCLKNSQECGSWTAAISQAGLEEGSPMMVQLLPGGGADAAIAAATAAAVVSQMGTLSCSCFKKELTRVWQLDNWYQPGWAGGREPYDGAAAPWWRSRCCCCCCHSCCCCLSDHAAAKRTHQSVAAGQLLSARLG